MIIPRLMREFIEEECGTAIRHQLLAEIGKHGATKAEVLREFNYNRFNVYLDFERQEARIQDELDVSNEGTCSMSLAEFAAALNRGGASGS
jgi:hypothetical protein